MTEALSREAAECRVFGRYLIGIEPSEYVLRCYLQLLPSASVSQKEGALLIERSLMSVARMRPELTRVADAYARFFRPRSLLRRRLILLLAILENSVPAERRLNTGSEGTPLGVIAGLVVSLVASGLCLVAGIVLFGPVHLVSLVSGAQSVAEASRS
jgi:hypothetical protein